VAASVSVPELVPLPVEEEEEEEDLALEAPLLQPEVLAIRPLPVASFYQIARETINSLVRTTSYNLPLYYTILFLSI
jgi:hypothetical protein